jgi:hypothetical protein
VVGIFCNLEEAFDCVNHDILQSELELWNNWYRYNIPYKSYLIDRYQTVLIYNKNCGYSTLSNWTLIKHGVPQSTIFGPFLFFFV